MQNANSYLSWIDVSCGKQVSGFTTALGRLDVMCQNPATGVVHLGHSGGTTLCAATWSSRCVAPCLCHLMFYVISTFVRSQTWNVPFTLRACACSLYLVTSSGKCFAAACICNQMCGFRDRITSGRLHDLSVCNDAIDDRCIFATSVSKVFSCWGLRTLVVNCCVSVCHSYTMLLMLSWLVSVM